MANRSLNKILLTVGLVGIIGCGVLAVNKGCQYIKQELIKQARDLDNPYAYNFSGFIGEQYVTFNKFLRPQSTLRIETQEGQLIVYETPEPSFLLQPDELKVATVSFYKHGSLERKVTLESEDGRLEITTKLQLEFNRYLNEIYRKKFSK